MADDTIHAGGSSAPEDDDASAEELLARLRHAVRAKERFLNAIVHDLKSPLTSIKGYAQLAERRLDQQQHEGVRQALQVIDRQITRMNRMLQGSLDAVRLEAGVTELRHSRFDLHDLLTDVIETARARNTHRLECRGFEGSAQGHWDRERLEVAMRNVVDNALSYSAPGTLVLITLARVEAPPAEGGGDAQVEVAVRDEGIGIPADDLERIFEQFYRSGGALGVDGMGLGLYVARGIVSLHHGLIWAESEGESAGSTFHLRLPLDKAARSAA